MLVKRSHGSKFCERNLLVAVCKISLCTKRRKDNSVTRSIIESIKFYEMCLSIQMRFSDQINRKTVEHGSKEGFLKSSFEYNYKLHDRLFIRRQRNIVNSLIVRAIPSCPIVNLIVRLLTCKTRGIKEQISEETLFQNLFSIFPFYFLVSFFFSVFISTV